MPAKKNPLSQAEQTQRFRLKVQELIDAGELNPTDAEAAVDRLLRRAKSS